MPSQAASGPATSGGGFADETATRRRLQADIGFLAADALEGRGTPGRGLDMAALYLTSALRATGWAPGNGDSYLQPYTIREYAPTEAKITASINGIPLEPSEFFLVPIGMEPRPDKYTFPLVFAGRGILAPEREVDDFAGRQLRDKAVLALQGAPWDVDPKGVFGYDRSPGKAISVCGSGGRLMVYASHEFSANTPMQPADLAFLKLFGTTPMAYLPEMQGRATFGMCPVLLLSHKAFDRTLAKGIGGSYTEWQQRLAQGQKPPADFAATVEVTLTAQTAPAQPSNVVAILPGTDLKTEWVVLTAHYDHLGTLPETVVGDRIFNGADDNASGTAALLEIARRLAAGKAPRRSVLLLFTSGEERGLLGSAHYALHPLVPYQQVVVNVNIDMVGRSTGAVQGIVDGAPELAQEVAKLGKKHTIEVLPDQNPAWRIAYLTDHYHFLRFDVPAIEFFTGLHSDYHNPTDEADKIRYDELVRIVAIIHDLVAYYGDGAPAPKFERPPWFLTP